MNIFNYFFPKTGLLKKGVPDKGGSAPVARERLQILLAHERVERTQSDLIGRLRDEIVAVIARHVKLDPDKVRVKMDRSETASMLAVDIELPSPFAVVGAAA